MAPEFELFFAVAVALAVGLLIGLEREKSSPPAESAAATFLGGARTHPIFSLIGALSALLARGLGVWVVVLAGLGVLALLLVSYADDVRSGRDRGLTSEGALFLSFLLGALALSRGVVEPAETRFLLLGAIAVVTTWLLSAKPILHDFVQKLSAEDVSAALKFLLVSVVLLPLLPDRTFGPLDVLNPSNIGFMAVLIAGISFAGYLAVRIMGARRGIGLTGLLGGLVSSTAVTLSFSGQAKKHPSLAASCALAITLASSIMFGRVMVTVAVVNPALLAVMAIPTGMMAAGGLLGAAILYRRARQEGQEGQEEVSIKNPFELSSAFKFALFFAFVLLASKAATTYFGTGATYLAGILAGLTDVDAITLSMARLAQGGQISDDVASTTIFFGVASNTLVKGTMATVIGGRAFGLRIWLAFGLALALGGLGVGLVWGVL